MGGLNRQTARSASANGGVKRGRGPSIFFPRRGACSESNTPPRQHGNLRLCAGFSPRNARDRRVGAGTCLFGFSRASSRPNIARARPAAAPLPAIFPSLFFGTPESSRVATWERRTWKLPRCPVPPRLWLRRPIPRPRTDPSGFLTRRVNQTSSNPASFGLDTGDASDLRDRRLTPRDFRHPRGSPTARLFETVRVPARAKV